MSHLAAVKSAKVITAIHTTYGALALLGANTLVLLAVEQSYGIPSWIKSATAIFLAL